MANPVWLVYLPVRPGAENPSSLAHFSFIPISFFLLGMILKGKANMQNIPGPMKHDIWRIADRAGTIGGKILGSERGVNLSSRIKRPFQRTYN